jgi:aldose sugar dehydrogenase
MESQMNRSASSPVLAGALLLMACAAPPPLRAQVESQFHDFRVVTVADGLVHPWSIAFLPGGDMLVTERPGRLRIIRDGVLLPEPVPGVPEVRASGQGGLMEVLPHPDFASNRLLYISYSKPLADNQVTTAVARGRFENDRLSGVEDIFVAQSRGSQHFGGKLAFDGRGHLFITVGDRQARPAGDLAAHPAQDLSNHQGTVIRIHDDGRVPADNPFVGRAGALPEIWSYGHRNPQGLIIHPETGEVWTNEHGPQGGDELNLTLPGRNYGWPVVGHGVNYGSGTPIHAATQAPGMEDPVHYWTPSIATSGMMLYTGDVFPQWRGSLFIGGMAARHEQIARLTLDGHRVSAEETITGIGRVRDIRQGPDGYVYVAIDHRGGQPTAVVRLEPVN